MLPFSASLLMQPNVARETTPRAGAVVPATRFVVRATVDASTPRFTMRPLARLVELERAVAPDDCAGTIAGAIGSAKTARIDKNVEHTKNAPANRNTVPMAFFATVAILRLFIHYSPADANPTNPPFPAHTKRYTTTIVCLYYNIFGTICPDRKHGLTKDTRIKNAPWGITLFSIFFKHAFK